MGRETQGGPAGEQKLERYGVWVKVEPRTVAETQGAESPFELTDLEAGGAAAQRAPSAESTLTVEEEKLLDELDTELGPSGKSRELSIPEEEPLLAEDEELPEISDVEESSSHAALEEISDDDLPELEIEEEPAQPAAAPSRGRRGAPADVNEVEVTLSETGAGQERFEDLDELESELASVATSASEPHAGSSEILARIEEELRSIRTDLTQLRSELSGMRKGTEPAVETPPSAAEAQSGFFDEDEDETIALTGDELDNILNTAEITEEEAGAAAVEDAVDIPELAAETTPTNGHEDVLSLEAADTTPPEDLEELPAELELEDLSSPSASPTPVSASLDGLPELDLEGIPEIETPEKGDLETLDLEAEAGGGEAAPDGLELLEEAPPAGKKDHADDLAGDVDLEALAAEAEALEDDEAPAPVEDLEIGELEAVTDEAGSAAGAQQEIEIPFENEPAAGRSARGKGGEAEEELLDVEELSAEEAQEAAPAGKQGGATAIPDDLKDEIRTVLKYMDHLLEALPEDKIQEFAKSDYFVMYKKLFEDLGLGE
ncbi:MAG: hypothetical protein ABSG17_22385 [Spirochaetia bacterium]